MYFVFVTILILVLPCKFCANAEYIQQTNSNSKQSKQVLDESGESNIFFESLQSSPNRIQSSEENEDRYIVKYAENSTLFVKRLEDARRKLSDSGGKNLRYFLPAEKAEVMYLESVEEVRVWEENDEVEYVELGENQH